MKKCIIVSMILLFGCHTESKTEFNTNYLRKNLKANTITTQPVDIDSLKMAHKHELFFLSFWNGMSEDDFKKISAAEVKKQNIRRDSSYIDGQYYISNYYKFKFENKTKLPIPNYTPILDDFLNYEVAIYTKFKDSQLIELELRKGLKAAIKLLDPTIDKEELYKEMRIEEFSEGELIELYKKKYGIPKTTKGTYSQAYERESVVLTWVIRNKLLPKQNAVVIEYFTSGNNNVNLEYIKYVDWANYSNEESKQEVKRRSTLDKRECKLNCVSCYY